MVDPPGPWREKMFPKYLSGERPVRMSDKCSVRAAFCVFTHGIIVRDVSMSTSFGFSIIIII